MIVEGLDDENDIEFLRRNLNGFSNEHKVDYNYSTSLSFDIKAPILKDGAEFDNSNYLIVITGKKDKDKTDYYLQYNQELFWRINNYIYNTHYQNIELKKFKIKLDINNDERNTRVVSGMLTYDSGNVQDLRPFVGDDGSLYWATEDNKPHEGVSLLTRPTATTINGQQALVAENGPDFRFFHFNFVIIIPLLYLILSGSKNNESEPNP